MKIALIFPPQWDPRQPPLCIPTLAGALKREKHDVWAWDMNLALYRSILFQQPRSTKTRRLIKQYLNPRTLSDKKKFEQLSDKVEDLIDNGYRRSNIHSLYWDLLDTGLSEDKSRNWRRAINRPSDFPFCRRMQPLIREVIQWMPELVCISMNSDTQIFGGLSIASGIRSKSPQVKIVVGGHALRGRRNLLLHHDWLFKTVDAICVSHGEPTLRALARHTHMSKVPNIIWYDGQKIRGPNNLKAVTFSADYAPDFSVIKVTEYLSPRTVIPIETARGCAWSQCSFCGHTGLELNSNTRCILRPLKSVLSEIRGHLSKGYNRFFFVDEAIPYERFRMLSKGLSKMKGNLSWICYLRAEQALTFSDFRLARQSGCLKVFVGIETGSERLLRLYKKGTTPDIAKQIILDASRAGLSVHMFLIIGFPDETEVDRKATDAFLKDVLPFVETFGFTYDIFQLKGEIGTPLYIKPTLFGAARFKRAKKQDLRCEFIPLPTNKEEYIPFSRGEARIKSVIERCLKDKDGLSHLEPIDDSTHLLLIESRHSTLENQISKSKKQN